MEFSFDIADILPDVITRIEGTFLKKPIQASRCGSEDRLWFIIDELGEASAKSQGLSSAITSGKKQCNSDHILYIIKDESPTEGKNNRVIGILKVGKKRLFVYDQSENQHEVEPVCVLDFYVHESAQRKGYGKRLFDHMLNREQIEAGNLAIDRPSSKFLSFLGKHYGLKEPLSQINNFTIYPQFFESDTCFVRSPSGPIKLCSPSGPAPMNSGDSSLDSSYYKYISYPYATCSAHSESTISSIENVGDSASKITSPMGKVSSSSNTPRLPWPQERRTPKEEYSPSSIAAIALGYSATESYSSSRRKLPLSRI